jgi:signal transduction histidine kinase
MIVSEDSKPSVLVIDDSDSIRLFVADLLRDAEYLVFEAKDGIEGLVAVEAFQPDVILLDVEMPGKNGYEVLEELNRIPHFSSVIMFTTLSALHDIVNGLERGADDYIAKPFNPDELLARVKAALRTARFKKQLEESRLVAESALEKLKNTQSRLVAQEKVASVARLAAGAAHNINNPLGFLVSNLATLERYADNLFTYSEGLSAMLKNSGSEHDETLAELGKSCRMARIKVDLKPLLQETREGGERIGLIVRRLARLEMGLAFQQVGSLFNLTAAIDAIVANQKCPEGIMVAIAIESSGEQLQIAGPITLFNSACEEILGNAVEAIGTSAGTIRVSVARDDREALLMIEDSGEGIVPEALPQMFDPFFTTRDQSRHVGLGMTIAERFIDLIGGVIQVDSCVGKGTCVTIRLPLAE